MAARKVQATIATNDSTNVNKSRGAQPENDNAVTHGVYSIEARGAAALNPAEVESLRELRDLVKSGDGRQEVREEITARLVLICRKMFIDMSKDLDNPCWWDGGVVVRGGTYLGELRRWLDTFPNEASRDNSDVLEVLASYRVKDDTSDS